jgi:threonine dehydrogenase-like Zn-dependent dehydrogenase
MAAVVCHGPEDYALEEVGVPRRGPGELLLKVEGAGICASDLKCFRGAAKYWGDGQRPAWAHTEVIPGHEIVGTVVELDQAAAAHWRVREGDRVVVEQIVPCWDCRACRSGRYNLCAKAEMYGYQRPFHGAMAQYMVCSTRSLVHVVSPDLPAAHAAFAEPLSCSLHAVERAGLRFADTVVVAGCGPIGLSMIGAIRARNVQHVVALDVNPDKLDLAQACGADIAINIATQDVYQLVGELTDGYGADVYFEATGRPEAVRQGLRLLRPQGTFLEYSVFKDETSVDWSIISDDKELDVLGAHLGPGCWPAAIRMLEHHTLPMDRICTHQLPLDHFLDGFDLVASGTQSIKVTLIP